MTDNDENALTGINENTNAEVDTVESNDFDFDVDAAASKEASDDALNVTEETSDVDDEASDVAHETTDAEPAALENESFFDEDEHSDVDDEASNVESDTSANDKDAADDKEEVFGDEDNEIADQASDGDEASPSDDEAEFERSANPPGYDPVLPGDRVDQPAGFKPHFELRMHQRVAIGWMRRHEQKAKMCGGILADQPGLGKTITVAGLLLYSKEHGDVRPPRNNGRLVAIMNKVDIGWMILIK